MMQRCTKTKRSGTANRLCVAKGTFLRLQLALLRWQFVRFCVGSSRFCVGNLWNYALCKPDGQSAENGIFLPNSI